MMTTTITRGFGFTFGDVREENIKLASPNQIRFYYDLCNQRGLTPREDVENLSWTEMSNLIDEVKRVYPPSDKQLSLIKQKLINLEKVGIIIDMPKNLTGGRNGTASAFIAELIELEEKHVNIEPSEAQINIMMDMYFCPDVDFESYGIEKFLIIGDNKIRYTPDEFVAEIKKNLNRTQASEFIQKYLPLFNEWRKTRITLGQFEYLKTLLERCGVIDIENEKLMMLSQENASEWISQLKDELNRKEESSLEPPSDEEIRRPQSIEEMIEEDENMLRKILYNLMAESGHEIDDLEETLGNNQLIKDYVLFVLTEGLVEQNTIVRYAQNCQAFKEALAC